MEAYMSQRSIFETQAELFKCMSSPIRIEIIQILRDGPQRVSEIARITSYPQAIISRNLGVLRNGGVVIARRRYRDVIYEIANPKIVEICDLMREVLAAEASRYSKLLKGYKHEHSG
jgi:ArsR family transcriptional regulator